MSGDTRQAIENAARRRKAADIGTLPDVVDDERREFCRVDLHAFLTSYFPHTTGLKPFCDEQKGAIKRIEIAILQGGSRVLNLFPRGFAKTTISENAALWAVLYGHCRFIPIIGADEHAAKDNIDSIKMELMTNDLLFEDFPEVMRPVQHLENKAQRCRSQTYDGEPTHPTWGMDKLVLPSIKRNGKWTPASGNIIATRGLTGRIRGMAHKRPDGSKQRPDFVIIDDPQTDMSAMSPAQCNKRLSLIRKGVLRLGGHQSQLGAVMNATVIVPDDAVDQLADHVKHPEWEGLRIPMLKTNADGHEEWWLDKYADIRRTYDPEDPHDRKRAIADSNQFYRDNLEAMNAGAEATWEHCFYDDEISAVQHAYNILIDDGEDVFASECQNRPIRLGGDSDFLTAGDMNRDRVGTWSDFPNDVKTIGFHIDVQKRLLYFTVLGISEDFRLYPRYGTYPQQRSANFEYRTVKKSIQKVHQGMSEERAIQKAIETLLADLCTRLYKRQDGLELGYDAGLIDGGYQTASVRSAIAESKVGQRVHVLFGRGVKAGDVPLLRRNKGKGEIRTTDAAVPWIMRKDPNSRTRNVFNDTNALKTFLHRRIQTDAGRAGSFELPKGEHRKFCEHIASSEYPTETEGPHGKLLEWRQMPGDPDNHWLDTTCGAIVACSVAGKVAFNRVMMTQPKKNRRRVSYL